MLRTTLENTLKDAGVSITHADALILCGGVKTIEDIKCFEKSDLVNDLGFTKKKSVDIIEGLIEIIKSTLAGGEDVLVSGFGKFSVKGKRSRRGRNPATGDDLILRERKVVTFKCSGKLREKINGES